MESTLEARLADEYLKHPRVQRRDAYAGFVAMFHWEWFVTLTFSEDVGQERSCKLFRVWVCQLNRHLYGRRWAHRIGGGACWVLASEPQQSGRIHFHALLAGVSQARRLEWMDRWFALDDVTGYARIKPVENPAAVSRYVTKYVVKGGEIEFSPNMVYVKRQLDSGLF